jgi:hypothetical protein
LDKIDQGLTYSALVANEEVDEILSKPDWDLHLDSGPGLCSYHNGKKEKVSYCRFVSEGVEPIVYYREFPGKESYFELSEEFRLYLNLYERYKSNAEREYIYVDDNGDGEEVAIVSKNKVMIRLKYLKQYISARNMVFVIYFDLMRFSKKTLEELSLKDKDETNPRTYFIYNHLIRNIKIGEFNSQSWLYGKVFIPGSEKFKPKLFEDRKTEKFIVGLDKNGNEKYLLSSKNILIPVYFKREVLNKYYNDPSKFEVGDGLIRAHGLWTLRIDNNNLEYVVVFLKDLRLLPYKEQVYWKSYNIVPPLNGGLSRAAYLRNMEGRFAGPDLPDHSFKEKYREFSKKWYKKFGWFLFKPLSKNDGYHLVSLHIPSPENRKEFDEQVISLTKIMIDSLNEKELKKRIIKAKDEKGISKFDEFLKVKGCKSPPMIKFFRNLQGYGSTQKKHKRKEIRKSV